jgi:hypothetical protein
VIRQLIAFLIAPLIVPILLFPYLSSRSSNPNFIAFIVIVTIVFAYVGMIIFGLPMYLFLRRHRWTSFWIAPSLGFLVGAVVWMIFSIVFVLALGEGISRIRLALSDPPMLKGMVWPGGVLGASVGVLFWTIARPDK